MKVEDICPRKARDYVYVLLTLEDGITAVCSEALAQMLCINEPYELKGEVKFRKGGSYLKLEKAILADGNNFRHVID